MNAKKRDLELDLIRFFCACSVMMYHYSVRGFAGGYVHVAYTALGSVFRYGFFGVDLFFMISGYVILMSASAKSAGDFTASRIGRLYPAYWLGIVLTTCSTFFSDNSTLFISPKKFLVNLTMLQDFFRVLPVDLSYWSLTYELKFYFCIILVSSCITRKKTFERVFQWWLLAVWLAYFVFPGSAFLDCVTIKGSACYFIAGAMFYLIRREGFTVARIVCVVLCYLLLLAWPFQDFVSLEQALHVTIEPTVYRFVLTGFFALFFLVSLRPTLIPGRLAAPITVMGALTYPLYLIHGNMGWIVLERLSRVMDKHLALAAVITMMLTLAYAINRFVERPCCRALTGLARKGLARLTLDFHGPKV